MFGVLSRGTKIGCLEQDKGLITVFILVFLVYFIVISPTHPTTSPYWLMFSHCAAGMSPTFLSGVNGGHRAERAFSSVIVNPHFDLVRGEWGDGFILENVSRCLRGGDSSLHPTLRPQWAESHHIAETGAALELLGNGLKRSDMTQGDGVTQVSHGIFIFISKTNFTSQVMTSSERPPPPPFTLAGVTLGTGGSE